MKYHFILIAFVLSFASNLFADAPLVLSNSQDKFYIGTYMKILEDPGKNLNVHEIRAKESTLNFKKGAKDILNLGYTRSAYWIKFSLRNESKNKEWILDFDYPLIDDIQIFDLSPSSEILIHHGGRFVPFNSKADEYRCFSFHMTLQPGVEKTFILRIESEDSLPLPISIIRPVNFYNKSSLVNLLMGLYFGMIGVIILCNIFIYISTHDRSSLHCILVLIPLHLMFYFSLNGYSFQFIGRNSLWWSRESIAFFEILGVIGAIIFTKTFLNTAKNVPRLNNVMNIDLAVLTGILILSPFISYFYLILSAVIMTMVGAFLMWVSGIICIFQGNKAARFYVAGWTSIEILGMIYGLKALGLFPSNSFTEFSFMLGAGLHAMFFLFAIADSFNLLIKSKESAQYAMLESEKKYRIIAENIRDVIWVMDIETLTMTYVSPSVKNVLGFTPEEFVQLSIKTIITPESRAMVMNVIAEEISIENKKDLRSRGPVIIEPQVIRKDGAIIDVETVTNFIRDEKRKPVSIIGSARDVSQRKAAEEKIHKLNDELEQRVIERTDQLNSSLKKVEHANKNIMSSLRYAKTILMSMLPNAEENRDRFSDLFIIWMPRYIVGGDFYYIDSISKAIIVAVADCTGHGVPGAFLTMIANSELKKITRGEKCCDPAAILKRLNKSMIKALNLDTKHTFSDDGLDIGICALYPEQGKLVFAGAKNSLLYVKDMAVHLIKGDKKSIGYVTKNTDFTYTNHTIEYNSNMSFYLATDGFVDQLGDKKGRRFGSAKFSKLILENNHAPSEKQKEHIIDAFHTHKGDLDQVDDITLIGFKPIIPADGEYFS
ncbi:MAG: PAS domain S-box protein [Proteobacteria bacterium]|nr:PAS domain S-box protein [Pseudomonadota bacterium]